MLIFSFDLLLRELLFSQLVLILYHKYLLMSNQYRKVSKKNGKNNFMYNTFIFLKCLIECHQKGKKRRTWKMKKEGKKTKKNTLDFYSRVLRQVLNYLSRTFKSQCELMT